MRLSGYIITGLIVGLGICVWLTLVHPQIRDRNLAQSPANPTPTEIMLPSSSPTGSPGLAAGQAIVKLLPFEISLTVADPIVDLVYGRLGDDDNPTVGFTTESLLARYPACSAGALGTLVRVRAPTPSPTTTPSPTPRRSTAPTRTPQNQPFKKTIDGYIYTYRTPTFSCATSQTGRDTLAAARAALVNGSLPTLVK